MLKAEKSGKEEATKQYRRFLPGQDQREDQNPIHEAIVLEMNMIDDQEAG